MRRVNSTSLLLSVLVLLLLAGASTRIGVITKQRLTYDLEPPTLASSEQWSSELRLPTAALTIFRSLAIDYLWIRADDLKNEGQYFDALHLARLICALQPNLPTVWQFNAWNMAYNISVGLPTWPERWHWVRAGFELLRDEGLVNNEKSLLLYRELGWIFQHKIGGITDDAHRYYKSRLAYELMPLLGPGDNEEIAALAEAPRRWDVASSAPFREDDLLDPVGWCLRIRDEEKGVSVYLRERMSEPLLTGLKEYDFQQELPDLLRLDMLNELNRALLDDELYDKERFAEVKLSENIRELISQNPRGWNAIGLNRLLLEAAYSRQIAPQQSYRLDDDAEIKALLELFRQAQSDLDDNEKVFDALLQLMYMPQGVSREFAEVAAAARESKAFFRLALFVRARELRRRWKIEPLWMIVVNRMYGPVNYDNDAYRLSLDWRSPFTHAIYWAVRGLEYAGDRQDIKELNLRRMIYHSLQDLFHYGRMRLYTVGSPLPLDSEKEPGSEVLSKETSVELRLFLSEDLRMFPVAYQATLDIIKTRTDKGERPPGGLIDGSINLCRSGVVNLYLAGHTKLAGKYYQELFRRRPADPDHRTTLEVFVRDRMKEEVESLAPKAASDYIVSILRDAYSRYGMRDDDNVAVRTGWARQIHALCREEFPGTEGDRMQIPDFAECRWLALTDLIKDPMLDQMVKSALLQRLKVEDTKTFDRLIAELTKQSESNNAARENQNN